MNIFTICRILIALVIVSAIIINERQNNKREAERLRVKRKSYRDVELCYIGDRLRKEIGKNNAKPFINKTKKTPTRKVCGDFAYMAHLWEYDNKENDNDSK